MPSSIGHALAGVAVAWIADFVPGCQPAPPAPWTAAGSASWGERAGGRFTLVCAALAALADIDLAFRVHRTATHSIGAVILVTIISGVVTGQVTDRPPLRVALICGSAYATHLLLDWMAADYFPPFGIQALWPFSRGWYISGWDVFEQISRRHFFSTATILSNAHAVLREVAILAPIVALLGLVRVKTLARLAAQAARRDHPAE